MVKKLLKYSVWIILPIVIIALIANVSVFVWFQHTSLWKYNADFKGYEAEFILVKDYVTENIPQGGIVSISRNAEHYYDLYLISTPQLGVPQYMNCPQDTRDALANIAREAFYYKDANWETIRYENGKIIFCIENGQYALVYSPNEKPYDALHKDPGEKVFCKKIQKGWYHVALYH